MAGSDLVYYILRMLDESGHESFVNFKKGFCRVDQENYATNVITVKGQ